MRRFSRLRLLFFALALAAGAALLVLGGDREYTVRFYEPMSEEDRLAWKEAMIDTGVMPDYPFREWEIDELDMVLDTLFTGVVRDGALLLSTYDRDEPLTGKQACPT
jgi:hypothetical protein